MAEGASVAGENLVECAVRSERALGYWKVARLNYLPKISNVVSVSHSKIGYWFCCGQGRALLGFPFPLSLSKIRNKFEISTLFCYSCCCRQCILFLHVHTCVSIECCLSAWKPDFHWQKHHSHSIISFHISESSKKQYLVKLDEDSHEDGHFFTALLFEKRKTEIWCNSVHRDRRLHSWKVTPFDMIK